MSPFLWNIQETAPAILAEGVADFADGAIAVVGVDVEQDGDAAGAVAFELKFFVGRAGKFARAALNGTLDIVGRHVFGLGSGNCGSQARIRIRIAAAFGGNADFLNQASENLAALGVERALFVLNCGPF